jgi:cytochrome c556
LYSARLQELMMDLQVTTERNWPAAPVETDASLSDETRLATFDEACALAAALESAAQRMPAAARKSVLTEADLQRFSVLARQLKEQSADLEQAGIDRDVTQMQLTLDRVTATCDSCHRQFRDLAGPLEVP